MGKMAGGISRGGANASAISIQCSMEGRSRPGARGDAAKKATSPATRMHRQMQAAADGKHRAPPRIDIAMGLVMRMRRYLNLPSRTLGLLWRIPMVDEGVECVECVWSQNAGMQSNAGVAWWV